MWGPWLSFECRSVPFSSSPFGPQDMCSFSPFSGEKIEKMQSLKREHWEKMWEFDPESHMPFSVFEEKKSLTPRPFLWVFSSVKIIPVEMCVYIFFDSKKGLREATPDAKYRHKVLPPFQSQKIPSLRYLPKFPHADWDRAKTVFFWHESFFKKALVWSFCSYYRVPLTSQT